jgi:hypothetical protein
MSHVPGAGGADGGHRALMGPKDQAYRKRNRPVAYLSNVYPSHLARHPEDDLTWKRDWMTIVCVHGRHAWPEPGPFGGSWREVTEQMTWHIHDTEVPLFAHLEMRVSDWHGHDTAENYRRLARLPQIVSSGGHGHATHTGAAHACGHGDPAVWPGGARTIRCGTSATTTGSGPSPVVCLRTFYIRTADTSLPPFGARIDPRAGRREVQCPADALSAPETY